MSGTILDADMATVAGWLARASRWWLDELRGMIPARWRLALRPRPRLLAYTPDDGDFAPLPGESARRGARVEIVLPAGLCLLRRIERQAMNRRDLEAMIALEGDRIMPLGESMVLGCQVRERRGRSGHDGLVEIDVAGLPRDQAARLAEALARADLAPARILTGEDGDAVDMLPALRRAGLVRSAASSVAILWAAAGVLLALNVALLVWRDVATLDAMRTSVAEQQPAIDSARRIAGRMRSAQRAASQTIQARAHTEPVMLLTRIGAAMPPGAWLQRLNWQEDTVRLTGFRPARADVSGALRRAGFAVGRYGDGTTNGETPFGQPFEITVRLGRR